MATGFGGVGGGADADEKARRRWSVEFSRCGHRGGARREDSRKRALIIDRWVDIAKGWASAATLQERSGHEVAGQGEERLGEESRGDPQSEGECLEVFPGFADGQKAVDELTVDLAHDDQVTLS